MNYKISIIIPVHNAENTLSTVVESFISQKYSNLEIILVENNSSDNSFEICKNLQSKYTQVTCIQSNEIGVSSARNLGLSYATGDIIGFADDDDAAFGNSLKLVADTFDINPNCMIVVGGINSVNTAGKPTLKCIKKNSIWSFDNLLNHSVLDDNIMGSVCNKFFKKELLLGATFDTSLSFCEDTHFLAKVLSKNKKLFAYILNKPIYSYIHNSNSATNSIDKMFDNTNKLHYNNAMQKIINDCDLNFYNKIIIKRAKFILATTIYCGRNVTKAQSDSLKKDIKNNIFYFLITFFLNFKTTIDFIKRLIFKKYAHLLKHR